MSAAFLLVAAFGQGRATSDSIDTDEIRSTLDRGRFREAERIARDELLELETRSADDGPNAAKVLDLLVESLQRQERGFSVDVKNLAERALALKEKFLPPDDPGIAPTLANLARIRMQVDLDLSAALALADEAIRIAEGALEPGDERLARYRTVRAEVLLARGDLEAARADLDDALSCLKRDSSPILWTDALYVYGKLEFTSSDFDAAAGRYREALEHIDPTLGPDHPEAARMYGQLANTFAQLGRYDEAGHVADRCLEIVDARYGMEHVRAAECLQVLAWIAKDNGTLTRSRRIYEQALGIFERTVGPAHRRLLPLLNNYAVLLDWSGELQESRAVSEQAIEIAERYWGPSDYRIGWLLNGYGNLLRNLGDDVGAVRAFTRALDISEASGRSNLLQWSSAMINLAYQRQTMGELEDARRLYAEAIPVFEELATGPVWRSEIKQVYGDLLSRLGEHDEAIRLHGEVLDMRRRELGPEHSLVAQTLDSYADALERSGNVAGALDLRRKALGILEKTHGLDDAAVGRELWEITQSQWLAGRPGEAFDDALRAETIRAHSLRLAVSALPERSALEFVETWPSAQPALITAVAVSEQPTEGDVRSAWDALVRSRAVVTDELAARHRSLMDAGVPVELVEELTAARERVASLLVRGEGADYPGRFREALEERERVEARVAAISADFRRRRHEAEIGLSEVDDALPEDAALLALVRYEHFERSSRAPDGTLSVDSVPSYVAFVLSPDPKRVRMVVLGPAERIDAAVNAWLAEASSSPPPIKTLSIESMKRYREAGDALRKLVWDPLAEIVAGAARVFVVPDAALNVVNFVTLPTASGRYLLEDGPEFHYLSAERDIVLSGPRSPVVRLLAVGGPDFDAGATPPTLADLAKEEPLRASLERAPGTTRFRGDAPSCENFRALRFGDLPGAASEVEQIATIWSAGDVGDPADRPTEVLRLTGARAHETWFKTLAPDYDVLHLATHGFYLADDCISGARTMRDPLLLSGLALAGANLRSGTREDEDDGILTAEEVASLDLTRSDWVVLSGCETGRGRVVDGEGVFGLRRAFRMAGARTLIMSLWPVEDEATRRWMGALYRSRTRGAGTATAVHDAALHALRDNRRAGLPDHPFYWGAFVAAGDWR